jgi:FdrA protein
MTGTVKVLTGTYVDSVVQMGATRAMRQVAGIDFAAVGMGTPTNLEVLTGEGFDVSGVGSPNDLVIAVRPADASDDTVAQALAAAESALFDARESGAEATAHQPRTLSRAVSEHPESNVAIVSVPGDYATLATHQALSLGLDVLLFSDNVSVEDEIALKDRATRLGRLVMGPGAGTAVVSGIGLGFANVVRHGPVGVVAAAGTGAQEAMTLLDRWGVGVSQVIGVGGRDLSEAVEGRMAVAAVRSLVADAGTDLVFLVSKPPSARVAQRVLDAAGDTPVVASFVGLDGDLAVPPNARVERTLEGGALAVLDRLGRSRPELVGSLGDEVTGVCRTLPAERTSIRGLFSGGTLCYESLVVLEGIVGDVWSNVPLHQHLHVPAPDDAHVCLDLGEEEYTKGRPHPMIDPAARAEMLAGVVDDPHVAVVLMDVVLGHGSHADPAGELASVCAGLRDRGGPAVVTYVLGTEQDPQGLQRQRDVLRDAGCLVTETAGRAALAAAAIAVRDPAIVRRAL